MAEQEQEQDKSEKATPFKLQEAKRRGQVAKSMDFSSFMLIASMLTLMYFSGRHLVEAGFDIARRILGQAGSVRFEGDLLMSWLGQVAEATGHVLTPFFLTAVVVGVVASMVQTGPIFSVFPLKPDAQRLNPVRGFKRVFSRRMLFEGAKSVLKLGLFGVVAYVVVIGALPKILSMTDMDPRIYPWFMLGQTVQLVFKLALAILVVALLDVVYTRWDFGKKMRMSKREVKEEVKRREGDPHVRARQRELQREAAKRAKSLGRVPDADVLITNPTHLGIALRYERGAARAPRLLAKGAGDAALEMRRIAARHGIPVVERKGLARRLFAEARIDDPIPEDLYEPVARVYAEIYAGREPSIRVGVTS
jgi:flagellar biosynthetic protein FlhB